MGLDRGERAPVITSFTRAIGKDVRAEKDLPESERSHLLRALNLHEPIFEFHFPPAGPIGPGSRDQP